MKLVIDDDNFFLLFIVTKIFFFLSLAQKHLSMRFLLMERKLPFLSINDFATGG